MQEVVYGLVDAIGEASERLSGTSPPASPPQQLPSPVADKDGEAHAVRVALRALDLLRMLSCCPSLVIPGCLGPPPRRCGTSASLGSASPSSSPPQVRRSSGGGSGGASRRRSCPSLLTVALLLLRRPRWAVQQAALQLLRRPGWDVQREVLQLLRTLYLPRPLLLKL